MSTRASNRKHLLKFIALGCSLLLWFYVLNSYHLKVEKTLQVEYIVSNELVFASKPVQEVTYIFEGPRAFIRAMSDKEEKLVIDLTKPEFRHRMRYSLNLKEYPMRLPFGVEIEKIQPKIIPIKLERKTSKVIPIKPMFVGELPSGVVMKDFKLMPSELEVYGPRFMMNSLKELSTRNIDLGELLGHNTITTEIVLPDERMELLVKDPVVFEYTLSVPSANVKLEDLPIKFLTTKAVDSPIKSAVVELYIPPNKLKGRSKSSFNVQIWADIPSNVTGKMTVPLKALTPPGVHVVGIFPKSVVVNIK